MAAVVPTHVGVNRDCACDGRWEESCPHTRGGEPRECFALLACRKLSPHTWG